MQLNLPKLTVRWKLTEEYNDRSAAYEQFSTSRFCIIAVLKMMCPDIVKNRDDSNDNQGNRIFSHSYVLCNYLG